MGRNCIFRSEPLRSVPGQLFTLARQSWTAIFRLDVMYHDVCLSAKALNLTP
jgi:hypothetical protein